jgi:cytochrome bd-type quinol oxidase subunit 2
MASSETVPADAFNSDSVNSLPIAFSAVFLPFVLLFVALRFYCRHTSRANWGFDDVLVAIAAVGQIALAAICIGMFLLYPFVMHGLRLTVYLSQTWESMEDRATTWTICSSTTRKKCSAS